MNDEGRHRVFDFERDAGAGSGPASDLELARSQGFERCRRMALNVVQDEIDRLAIFSQHPGAQGAKYRQAVELAQAIAGIEDDGCGK